jgi:cell division septation protein DedD
MPSNLQLLVSVLLLALSQPAMAQYRATKRTADKEFELHAYHLAIRSYQRVLEYREDDQEALARLGHAYRMINELDSARQYYARAMNGRRVAAETLLGYAHTLKMLGDYEEAKRLYLAYAQEENQTVGSHYANSTDFARSQAGESAGYAIVRLDLNTAAPEFGPALPRAGQFVFNTARATDPFDGVMTTRPYLATVLTPGQLLDPVPVDYGNLEASGKVGPVSYSPDGTQVVFTRNTFTPGTRLIPEAGAVLNLFIAEVNPAGQWVNARPLPFNETVSSAGYGSFSPDGQSIYFASNRAGGFGGYDIYRAHRLGDGWEAYPENMGATLNSMGDEITPYYDGSSLFFASDYHQGLGGFDVFRAEMVRRRPSQLFHMGSAINSSRDDMGLIYDPESRTGYFVSNRLGNSSREDIYFVSPEAAPAVEPSPGAPPAGPVAGTPEGVDVGDAPAPYGTVRGFVSNLQTGAPVPDAGVLIVDRESGRAATTRSDVNGAYFASLENNTTYDVSVDAYGFESMQFPLKTGATPDPDLFGNIMLLPVQSTTSPEEAAGDIVGGDSESPSPPAPAPIAIGAPASPGFAVQLASLSGPPDLEAFMDISHLGRLYSIEEGGRYKVRLGDFANRDAALEATREVREAGYAQAFVVSQAASELSSPAPYANTPAVTGSYRVQLGAFGQPRNFDRERAASLGTLRSEVRNGLTVFLIEDIPDAATARRVQEKARAMGYPGAYALEPVGDGYRKLQ